MSKKVIITLADGFEEVEALSPADLLTRAGAQVILLGVGKKTVRSSHGFRIETDITASGFDEDFDCIILPGGMPGSSNLASDKDVDRLLKKADAGKKLIGAICAAPAVVLGPKGLLEGKKAVCFPGMEKSFPKFAFGTERVCTSANVVTARAAGCALEFGTELIRQLYSDEAAEKVAQTVLLG